jgi:two-component system chemotaxis response regulator CheY
VTVSALVVDDSPFARRIIRHQLTKFGCKVLGEAESAAQAMKLFAELKPDLVTLDVMMPEIEGYDSIRAFREMKKISPTVTILVVSVVPFDKTRDMFLKEGALAYVVKPFNQFSFEPVRLKLIRLFHELAA